MFSKYWFYPFLFGSSLEKTCNGAFSLISGPMLFLTLKITGLAILELFNNFKLSQGPLNYAIANIALLNTVF
jgi:hypothetical protein